MAKSSGVISIERIQKSIYLIRGQKVMLDKDLASLYGVETKTLIQAVKRNIERFPGDFMYQLADKEFANLRSQIVTSSWGGRRYLPYAFTEHGVAMLSSVLNSERAVQVNIAVIRAFIKMREMLNTHKELMTRLNELESKVGKHDMEVRTIFKAIHHLMNPPLKKKGTIGFHSKG